MDILRERLEIHVKEDTGADLWHAFSGKFEAVIWGTKGFLRKKVGLKIKEFNENFNEEIFIRESGQVIYYKIDSKEKSIEVGSLVSSEEDKKEFEEFKDIICKVVKNEGPCNWVLVKEDSKRFEMIKRDSRILAPKQMEMEASFLMKNDSLRNLLMKINNKGTCFQEEIVKGPSDKDTPQILNSLEAMGLITKEYYIFCLESGQQISKVNSLQALEEAREHGFKCFSCGRLLSEERISPRLKTSDLGKRFSQHNYWLALYLAYILESYQDAKIEDIFYITEKDGNVFDIFIKVFDEYLMFEVKDEPVQMEDVFMFQSRVSYYKPFAGLLLASHPVSAEVKLYLKNCNDESLVLVDDFNDLELAIKEVYQRKKDVYLKKVFSAFSLSTRIDLEDIFLDRLYCEPENILEEDFSQEELVYKTEKVDVVETIAEVPETIEVPEQEVESDTLSFEVEEGALEFEKVRKVEVEAEIPEEVEIEAEIPEEVEIESEIPEEVEVESEIPEEVEVESEIPEEITESFEREVETQESIEESLENAVMSEEDKEESKSIEEEIFEFEEEIIPAEEGLGALYIDKELSMEFDEALPDEIIPSEELEIIEEDTTEEELSKASSLIIDYINKEGISGNINLIDEKLLGLEGIDFYSGFIFDKDGMLITSSSDYEFNLEGTVGYLSYLNYTVSDLLKDEYNKPVESLNIEGSTGKFKIFFGTESCLGAYEGKKYEDTDEEVLPLSYDDSLKDTLLSNVLEELGGAEGYKGAAVVNSEGRILQSYITSDNLDGGILTGVSIKLLEDCVKFFDKLNIGKVSQLTIKTSEDNFNLILLKPDIFVALCFDNLVSKEIWGRNLSQAIQVLKSIL